MLCIKLEVPVSVIYIILNSNSKLLCLSDLISGQIDTVYLSCLERIHTCVGIVQHHEFQILYRTSVRIVEIFICCQSHMIVMHPLGDLVSTVGHKAVHVISVIVRTDFFICFLVDRIVRRKCQQMLRIRNRVFEGNFQCIVIQCLYTQF